MQDAISSVPLLIVVKGLCRGMLAAPGTGGTRASSVAPEARPGGNHRSGGGVSRRTAPGGDGGEAGTSHAGIGGASASRAVVGDSESESE